MSENLDDFFKDFKAVTAEEWERQARKELERLGKDADSILSGAQSGFFKPYLTGQDLFSYPGSGLPKEGAALIHEDFFDFDDTEINGAILKSLLSGVNSIGINFSGSENMSRTLADILPEGVFMEWHLKGKQITAADVARALKDHYHDNVHFKGAIHNDFIGDVLRCGSVTADLSTFQDRFLMNYQYSKRNLPHYYGVVVSGDLYHHAGAEVATELACILGHVTEYLTIADEEGEDLNEFARRVQINVGIGKDYFTEIAKFRALRHLWRLILKAFNCDESISCHISARMSPRHVTALDSRLNILRATTAAMTATIGGCNSIQLIPFDKLTNGGTSFSKRIARNIHHLLKEESYLEINHDPSAGSYLLENLTDHIGSEAWNEFREMENTGGLLSQLKSNSIQKVLSDQSAQEEILVKKGDQVILGVNKHPNPDENREEIVSNIRDVEDNIEGVDLEIKPLRRIRLSSVVEVS